MTPAVAVAGLTRTFGEFVAVDDVSFEIERGEVFGLLGANGAGKTTIIRMLCCIYRPTAGHAIVLGIDTRERPELIRARVGYMSQRFSLYGDLTVEENLRFYAAVYRRDDDDTASGAGVGAGAGAIERVCDDVGLAAEHRRTRVDALPTGIRQRAALAAAIAHEPQLLFLDEPTSGVDPRSRRVFWDLIRRLAERGTTVLVTTHAMGEAEGCDRIGMMAAGKMIAVGSSAELVEQTGMSVVCVEVSPWQEGFELIRERWPAAALYGRKIHVPTAAPDEAMDEAGALLRALDVGEIAVQRPTLEDAFVWHIGRAAGVG